MRSRGSLDHAQEAAQAAGRRQRCYEFTQAFRDVPESAEKTFLHQVISYMVSRDVVARTGGLVDSYGTTTVAGRPVTQWALAKSSTKPGASCGG